MADKLDLDAILAFAIQLALDVGLDLGRQGRAMELTPSRRAS